MVRGSTPRRRLRLLAAGLMEPTDTTARRGRRAPEACGAAGGRRGLPKPLARAAAGPRRGATSASLLRPGPQTCGADRARRARQTGVDASRTVRAARSGSLPDAARLTSYVLPSRNSAARRFAVVYSSWGTRGPRPPLLGLGRRRFRGRCGQAGVLTPTTSTPVAAFLDQMLHWPTATIRRLAGRRARRGMRSPAAGPRVERCSRSCPNPKSVGGPARACASRAT